MIDIYFYISSNIENKDIHILHIDIVYLCPLCSPKTFD